MTEKRIMMLRIVARCGSISQAARETGLSQATVSREIALLEKTMGTPLLKRTISGVVTTPAGEYLRKNSFGNLSAQLAEGCRRMAAGDLPTLALDTDMLNSVLAQPVLQRLAQRAPNMPVQLYCYKNHGTLNHLLSGTANAAFIHGKPARFRQRLAAIPLHQKPWLVAARADHAYWSMSPADRGVLRHQTVILDQQYNTEPNRRFTDQVSQYCSESCLPFHSFMEANFLQDQIMMLQTGLGVALLPDFAAAVLPPGIRLSDELATPFAPEISLVYRSDSRHPGVLLLQELCREVFGGEAHE